MSEFIVYSKSGCPYCTKIINVLQLAEMKYVEYKLGVDYHKPEFYSKFGQGATFPKIVRDKEVIGGCTETIKYLRENKLI